MSDLCRYVNNAYTDANPYEAHCTIVHDDATVVATFQAFYPNGRHGLSPVMAAGIYGAGGPTGPYTGAPWAFVDTSPPGLDINVPNATQFNSTVIDVCGNRVSYDWVTYLVLGGPSVPVEPTAEAIRTRRFICGFEIPPAEGNSGGGFAGSAVSRAASRVPGGLGMRVRSNENQFINQTLNKYGAPASKSSWERFYMRPYQFDAVGLDLWRCYGSAFPGGGVAMRVMSNGAIRAIERNSLGAETVLDTTLDAIPTYRWNRIDICVTYGNGSGTSGRFRLWLNSVLLIDAQSTQPDGLGQNGNHVSTDLGTRATSHNLEIDFDDWINAEIPVLFNGLDWLSGSHIRQVRPAGDGAGRADWTGDWRVGIQLPALTSLQEITSTVDNARLELVADTDTLEPLGEYQQGVVAMVIGGFLANDGSGVNGTLGFSIAGVDNLQAVTVPTTAAWNAVGYNPAGLTTPLTLAPFNLIHVRDTGVGTNRCRALQAAVECLGSWGVADQPVGVAPIPDSGIHNGPYWEHEAYRGSPGAPPFGEVIIESGVYTGNGIGQDLPKAGPGHFLFVRRVTSVASGVVFWHSGMTGPHTGTSSAMPSANMVQALIDSAGQALMRVAGNEDASNVNLSTYQWVMISDPAMRFVTCGAFAHASPQTVAATNLLADDTFYPEATFFFLENPESSVGGSRHWYKGVGHAVANAQQVNTSETVNVMSFGLGTIGSQTPVHVLMDVAYAAFRQFDGPGSASGPATSGCDPSNPDPGRVVGLTSYVGNGVGGTRVIPVALGGRRPLFAVVQPHDGFARYKDPSHVGTATGRLDSGDSTGSATEIVTGGVDFISVGITLNASGIVYDVFVLPGDEGGSGWSANGTFFPVPPAAPCGSIWPPNPSPPDPPPGPGAACSTADFPTELT